MSLASELPLHLRQPVEYHDDLPLPPTVRGVSLVRNFTGEFEVSPDGERFLFVRSGEGIARANLNVVLNWTAELARLVGRR